MSNKRRIGQLAQRLNRAAPTPRRFEPFQGIADYELDRTALRKFYRWDGDTLAMLEALCCGDAVLVEHMRGFIEGEHDESPTITAEYTTKAGEPAPNGRPRYVFDTIELVAVTLGDRPIVLDIDAAERALYEIDRNSAIRVGRDSRVNPPADEELEAEFISLRQHYHQWLPPEVERE